jgi:hypothetical protein
MSEDKSALFALYRDMGAFLIEWSLYEPSSDVGEKIREWMERVECLMKENGRASRTRTRVVMVNEGRANEHY